MKSIKLLRMAGNMKQTELAEKLGVTQGTVSYWESDGAFPAQQVFAKAGEHLRLHHRRAVRGRKPTRGRSLGGERVIFKILALIVSIVALLLAIDEVMYIRWIITLMQEDQEDEEWKDISWFR